MHEPKKFLDLSNEPGHVPCPDCAGDGCDWCGGYGYVPEDYEGPNEYQEKLEFAAMKLYDRSKRH